MSKNLDILIVGEKAGSKLSKAKQLISEGAKIEIIPEERLASKEHFN